MKKIIILIIFFIISIDNVLAYIDPGTTGMIIGGSIWPFILVIFAAIGGFFLKFFRPIKTGVSKVWGKIKGKN